MKEVKNKLRVSHMPLLGADIPTWFHVEVRNEREAYIVYNALVDQHLYLLEEDIICDYSNIILVEMYDIYASEWVDYHNEEGYDWVDVQLDYPAYFK